MPNCSPDTPVGLLVVERPERAAVFERFGIDYCCGGKLSIRWFCDKRGLQLEAVLAALRDLDEKPPEQVMGRFQAAPLATLAARIVEVHHQALRKELPRLRSFIEALAPSPRSERMAATFGRFSELMETHMAHEERVVFPLIIRIERGLADLALARRFLVPQMDGLEIEHQTAGQALESLMQLADELPSHAGDAHEPLRIGLIQLVADTHRYVHEENAVLFPRALALLEAVELTLEAARVVAV